MMLSGEAVRGIRPWTTTNEGDVWFTQRKSDGTVYAFTDLDFDLKPGKPYRQPGRMLTIKSVKTTPQTKITLLSQAGDLEWKEDAQGLHIKVERKQTIQLIRKPGGKAGDPISISWGPDWPVAVKITNAQPATSPVPGR
jgi:hypothetical protein